METGLYRRRTGCEDAVPTAVSPANQLPHLGQYDVFNEREDWRYLIREPIHAIIVHWPRLRETFAQTTVERRPCLVACMTVKPQLFQFRFFKTSAHVEQK